jgi:hypothetical protein
MAKTKTRRYDVRAYLKTERDAVDILKRLLKMAIRR